MAFLILVVDTGEYYKTNSLPVGEIYNADPGLIDIIDMGDATQYNPTNRTWVPIEELPEPDDSHNEGF